MWKLFLKWVDFVLTCCIKLFVKWQVENFILELHTTTAKREISNIIVVKICMNWLYDSLYTQ